MESNSRYETTSAVELKPRQSNYNQALQMHTQIKEDPLANQVNVVDMEDDDE